MGERDSNAPVRHLAVVPDLDVEPATCRSDLARWERETKHPRYLAMIDAAIARARKPGLH